MNIQPHSLPIRVLLSRLWSHIELRRRKEFGLLLLLMVCTSFAEVVSIGVVVPFLLVLTEPQRIFDHAVAQPMIGFLGFSSAQQLVFPVTLIFIAAAIVAGVMRLLLLWLSTRISFAVGADFSFDIYRRTLYQPYSVHVTRNSSQLINGITSKANRVIYNCISPILTILSSSILLVAVFTAMVLLNPVVSITAFCSFGMLYGVIVFSTRRILLADSKRVAYESTQVIKFLQEGLGGIRDVLIDSSQEAYCKIYRQADIPLRHAQYRTQFIGHSPRFLLETLGLTLIAGLAYIFVSSGEIRGVVPVLGALALAAQRCLPVMQQTYVAWTSIQGGRASLADTVELLDQPLPIFLDHEISSPLPFKQQIEIKQVSFRYGDQSPLILKHVNLKISKGECVGFIGVTGSGKSTLLDIVMGLLQPTSGTIEIDGCAIDTVNMRAWQKHIAHVPQAIFLTDSTIAENIAFGQPTDQIDGDRVRHVARMAQLASVIESWPEQYQTMVGERGIRLSGGQRQRIGIARALYKRASVIVLDEATSSLDTETEQAVMQVIEQLSSDITILVIAHRLSTLRNCTQIVELHDGALSRIGVYKDLLEHNS